MEGVEPGVEEEPRAVLVTGSVQGNKCLRGVGSRVDSVLVNVDGSGRREHLERPDDTATGRPAVAKDSLVVTVDNAHVGRTRKDGKLAGGLIEGLLDRQASASYGAKSVSLLS
jgi:hypothetical protein